MKVSLAWGNMRIISELASLTGAIVLVALYAVTAGILPAPYIPYEGELGLVGKYGLGTILTALFAMGSGIMGFLGMLSRFPKIYKSPVKLNANNIEIQYILSKIMLSLLQIVCAVYFSLLIIKIYRMQITIESMQFKIMSIAALFFCALIYFTYLATARHFK